jgi:hypothetical protein
MTKECHGSTEEIKSRKRKNLTKKQSNILIEIILIAPLNKSHYINKFYLSYIDI